MRVANRLAALLLGLVLLAGGLLVVVDAALAAAGRRPWLIPFDTWYGPLTRTSLAQPVVLGCSIGVGVLGLALFVVQVRRWVPSQLAVRSDTGTTGVSWWVHRRSVEREVSAAVDGLTGVGDTTSRLRGRGQRWRLTVSPRGRAGEKPAIERVVTAELARIAAPTPVKVRVAVRRPKRVA